MYFRLWTCVFLAIATLRGVVCIHGEVHYSYASYPHSLTEKEKCGREDIGRPIYICDPNRILLEKDARQLDVSIETVMNETGCQCSADICSRPESPGYRISVALLRKMELPDNEESDEPFDDTLKKAMTEASNFAYQLLKKWKLGRCTDDVLIFYSALDGVLYTLTGDEAGRHLDPYTIAEISMLRRADVRRNLFYGLMQIISDYKSVFLDLYKPMPRKKATPVYEAVIGGTQSVQYSTLCATLLTIVIALLSTKF